MARVTYIKVLIATKVDSTRKNSDCRKDSGSSKPAGIDLMRLPPERVRRRG
jgi:hypothetical protein